MPDTLENRLAGLALPANLPAPEAFVARVRRRGRVRRVRRAGAVAAVTLAAALGYLALRSERAPSEDAPRIAESGAPGPSLVSAGLRQVAPGPETAHGPFEAPRIIDLRRVLDELAPDSAQGSSSRYPRSPSRMT